MSTTALDLATYNRQQQIGRDNWCFNWRVTDLLPYVHAAHAYHDDRLDWWEHERAEAEREVRESIQLRQQQHTGGSHTEALLDPTRQQRLAGCESKIAGHRARSEELGAWLVVLNQADDQRRRDTGHPAILALTIADLRFFEVGEHAHPTERSTT